MVLIFSSPITQAVDWSRNEERKMAASTSKFERESHEWSGLLRITLSVRYGGMNRQLLVLKNPTTELHAEFTLQISTFQFN